MSVLQYRSRTQADGSRTSILLSHSSPLLLITTLRPSTPIRQQQSTTGLGCTAPPPARMASQAPSSSSVLDAKNCSYVKLHKWWLERMDGSICIAGLNTTSRMRNNALSSQENKRLAVRVFKCAIAKRCDSTTVETVNGYVVLLNGGILDVSQMRENGFLQEVCESFKDGLPIEWNNIVDSNMGRIDEQLESRSNGKQLVVLSRKQRSAFGKLQRAMRWPYMGNQSSLTRGRAKSLSLSTPEYLKLRKTKSGRYIVPALDPGCQNIFYSPDGSISAIVGLDSSPLKDMQRKRKRAH